MGCVGVLDAFWTRLSGERRVGDELVKAVQLQLKNLLKNQKAKNQQRQGSTYRHPCESSRWEIDFGEFLHKTNGFIPLFSSQTLGTVLQMPFKAVIVV